MKKALRDPAVGASLLAIIVLTENNAFTFQAFPWIVSATKRAVRA